MVHRRSNVSYSRYIRPMLWFFCFLCLLPAILSAQSAAPSPAPAPTLVVQIRCKPGTADHWQADFEKEILPSIQEVIKSDGGITKFIYLEAVLPGTPFDFVLIYEVKTLGALDVKRPWPHYVALARRVGEARAAQILKEMGGWEEDVKVTVMRTFEVRP